MDTRAVSDAMEGLAPPLIVGNVKTVNSGSSGLDERDLLIKSEFLDECLGTLYTE